VARSIDNGVVVLISKKLLGVALNGDTTFTFFLARIKVVGKTKGRLSLFFRHFLKLGHFTLGNSAALENQVTTSGRLAGIDVSADDKREMFLFRHAFSQQTLLLLSQSSNAKIVRTRMTLSSAVLCGVRETGLLENLFGGTSRAQLVALGDISLAVVRRA
jgi:hypothetical protein